MASLNRDIAVFEAVARQDTSLKWYAIADSAQHRDLPHVLVQASYQTQCLLCATDGSPVAKKAPHLVEISAPLETSSVWNWINLNAKLKPCLTVIAAPIAFETLFKQLAACTEVVLPDGDTMFFGFWDPAILGTLIGQSDDLTLHVKGPVLDSDQRSTLTHGLAAWWYWDRTGKMHTITVNQVENAALAGPIKLTQRQVDDLVEASVPDHVLYYLELNQPRLIAAIPSSKRYKLIHQALINARAIGLVVMKDLVNFVCITLIYKERMHKDALILDILEQVKRGQIKFDEALEALP